MIDLSALIETNPREAKRSTCKVIDSVYEQPFPSSTSIETISPSPTTKPPAEPVLVVNVLETVDTCCLEESPSIVKV